MQYRTAQPDLLCHQRLRMTGTEPHTPLGTAGRGPNWDRKPRADHAGAARRCTKRNRRLWALPGPLAVHGPRELTHAHLGTAGRETILGSRAASVPEELRDSERTYAFTHASRHRRPRDPQGDRAGGAA
jgi:hypothetical protein